MIRNMEQNDVASVFDLTCRTFDEIYRPEIFSFFLSEWKQGQIVASDYVGNLIGYLSSVRDGTGSARMMMLAVDTNFRKIGVGSSLVMHFKRTSMMSGVRDISLEVKTSNSVAVKFYKNHGFLPTDVATGYYSDGEDALMMRCPLQLNI